MVRRSIALFLSVLLLWGTLAGCGKDGLEAEPDQWKLEDFAGCLEARFDTAAEEYPLLEGTEEENTVRVLRGAEEGPTVYLVAGVHGDEVAGWRAGNLLKDGSTAHNADKNIAVIHDRHKVLVNRGMNQCPHIGGYRNGLVIPAAGKA